jgi:hypothetical protein
LRAIIKGVSPLRDLSFISAPSSTKYFTRFLFPLYIP